MTAPEDLEPDEEFQPVLSHRSGLSWFGVLVTLTLPVGLLLGLVAATAIYPWARWTGGACAVLLLLGWCVGWFRGGFAMPDKASAPMQRVLRPTPVESEASVDQRGFRRLYVRLGLVGLVVSMALLFTTTGI